MRSHLPAAALALVLAAVAGRAHASDAAVSAVRTEGRITTLEPAGDSDSVIVLLCGDNRPGYRMQSRKRELGSMRGIASNGIAGWAAGLVAVPVLCVETILPALDGPRDLWTKFVTHRPPWGREGPVREAMLGALPADTVVSTGDLVTYGERADLWAKFVAQEQELRARIPFFAAPGNHERTDTERGRANWNAAMGSPPEPGQYWYALDLPDGLARFVFLDSNLFADARGRYPDSLQEAWSRAQLDWADSALAAPARYRFIVLHHPLVSAGHYLAMWGNPAGKRQARRRRLLDIARRRRVTAVLAGHEHLYQRVYIRTADHAGFWQVTTGGAGSPLHWLSAPMRRKSLGMPLPDSASTVLGSASGFSDFHFCRLVIPRRPDGGAALRMDVYQVGPKGEAKFVDRIDLAAAPEGP